MRLILSSLIIFLLSSNNALAIKFNGSVVDAGSGEVLSSVAVENLNSREIVYSDNAGNFFIAAQVGDSLACSILGYESFFIHITSPETEQFKRIELTRKVVTIDTVVIRSLTQYQKDSLARREIYGKALDKKPVKFGLAKGDPLYGGGPKGAVTFNAPISSIIQKRTKKYKRLKAFQDRFMNDEKQSYIDSRYTPQLITELTGLKDDSLTLFLKAFPIAYEFSRSATELELKMWVKYNYRTWARRTENSTEKE